MGRFVFLRFPDLQFVGFDYPAAGVDTDVTVTPSVERPEASTLIAHEQEWDWGGTNVHHRRAIIEMPRHHLQRDFGESLLPRRRPWVPQNCLCLFHLRGSSASWMADPVAKRGSQPEKKDASDEKLRSVLNPWNAKRPIAQVTATNSNHFH